MRFMDCLRRRSLSRDCLRSLARPFSRDLRERHRHLKPRTTEAFGRLGRAITLQGWEASTRKRLDDIGTMEEAVTESRPHCHLPPSVSWGLFLGLSHVKRAIFRIQLHVEIEVDCWNLFYRCGYDELMRNLLASNMIRSLFHSVRII